MATTTQQLFSLNNGQITVSVQYNTQTLVVTGVTGQNNAAKSVTITAISLLGTTVSGTFASGKAISITIPPGFVTMISHTVCGDAAIDLNGGGNVSYVL